MSAALAVQKAIRERLVTSIEISMHVPAENILDRNSRPAPMPSIILGEDQEIDEARVARNVVSVHSTLHVWTRETGLTGVKAIAGAIRTAVNQRKFAAVGGFHFADCRVSSTRFLRDPDGETAHGVVTIESLVSEVAS